MRLFCLPPGADFPTNFARGFWRRYGERPPEAIARIHILVNNRRSLRHIEEALLAEAHGPALLPRLGILGELGSDPLRCPDMPMAIDPLRRLLRLTRLVERFLEQERADRTAPLAAAPQLARSLANLIDEFDEEGLDLASLDFATGGEHAEHWARTLRFMEIIRDHWPAIVAETEGGAPGPRARHRAAVAAELHSWTRTPPKDPVIAAASTGSITTTAELLAAIACLPQGAVVLPAFDPEMEETVWQKLFDGMAPEHPFAPFRSVLTRVGAKPSDIAPWLSELRPEPRYDLLAQAMRPAPVTDAWHNAAPGLAPGLDQSLSSLSLVEAASPRQEAAAIAIAVREALDCPGKRVLVLTQDAGLARRIVAELDRFGIDPDDSLGRPLAQSVPAIFLRLIAEVAATPSDPVRVAGLLQHPLMMNGMARIEHLKLAQRYDLAVLRNRGFDAVDGRLPGWPESDPARTSWLSSLNKFLQALGSAMTDGKSLAEIVEAHIRAAEHLSRPDRETAPLVWDRSAGQAVEALMQRLGAAADAFGEAGVRDYPGLLLALMRSEEVRPEAQTPHPRVTLLSPREARSASADLTILAGLNEGSWPAQPSPDPWLSRPMRATLGLPSPEHSIGLSAHDFLHALSRGEALLTRALKSDGTPTVASRWLIRLQTLIDGIDVMRTSPGKALSAMKERGDRLLALTGHTHHPDADLKAGLPGAERPCPKPPAEARPDRISVTGIETLIRDPYAVYCARILNLHPLDPLGRTADYRDRGKLVHRILETFSRETPGPLPPDAEERLLAIADDILAALVAQPELRRIWRARVGRFAPWFLEGEARRRTGLIASKVEVKGQMVLPTPGVTITARADRIDLFRDGGAAIYDYKAGQPPSKKQIDERFNQQLHLQAAILEQGGFEGLSRITAHMGAYLGLTGSGPGGREQAVHDLSGEIVAHLADVQKLLSLYSLPETGYSSRRAVATTASEGDYDHLARFGEWEQADD